MIYLVLEPQRHPRTVVVLPTSPSRHSCTGIYLPITKSVRLKCGIVQQWYLHRRTSDQDPRPQSRRICRSFTTTYGLLLQRKHHRRRRKGIWRTSTTDTLMIATVLPIRIPTHPPEVSSSRLVTDMPSYTLTDIRGSSPYLPPVDTSTSSTETPSKYSPTRRRLPPTPGVASSSITPTVMPMPEPDTQYSRQNPYDSSFYTSFPPSNIPSDPTPRPAGERTSTSSNGRRLPEAPAYGNDSKHSYEDGSRTPVSTSDYQSHGSTTSYSSSASFSGYSTGATSTNGDGYHRPAVPPKPSAYRTNAADLMSTYDQAGGSGYGYPQTHYSPASRSETHTTAKPPVPPPPSHPSTKLSSYDLDSGDQYASAPYSLSPVHMSPCGS